MDAVEVKLSRGSHADPMILLLAVLACVFGFMFLYETGFWVKNEYSWKPMVLAGVFLFLIYFFRRLFSGKHQFTLVSDEGSHLAFQEAVHVAMSGWVLGERRSIAKKDVVNVKIENFYSVASHAGMYWVCFTMNDRRVIEYRIRDYGIVEKIKVFVSTSLPGMELELGERV